MPWAGDRPICLRFLAGQLAGPVLRRTERDVRHLGLGRSKSLQPLTSLPYFGKIR